MNDKRYFYDFTILILDENSNLLDSESYFNSGFNTFDDAYSCMCCQRDTLLDWLMADSSLDNCNTKVFVDYNIYSLKDNSISLIRNNQTFCES